MVLRLRESRAASWVKTQGSSRFLIADSREAIPKMRIAPKCIITSPPYFDVRRYPAAQQVGFGQNLDEFIKDIQLVFRELHKKARANATLWIVADAIRKNGELIPLPHLFSDAATKAGWRLQSTMVWHKDRTYPWLHDGRLRKIHETILLFGKDKSVDLHVDRLRDVDDTTEWWQRYPERYNPYGRAPVDIWFEKIPAQGSWGKPFLRHECPFPPRLVERMVELSTNRGDWVIDPFGGTGVVAATAAVMGRHGLAIDVAKDFERHFETDVRPAVEEWWQTRRIERESLQARQRSFFRANLALRLVKYGRVLIRQLEARGYPVLGAWLDASKFRRQPPWSTVRATLIARDSRRIPQLEREAAQIAARPPLSKFGLEVELKVLAFNAFRGHSEAAVYSNGSPTSIGIVRRSRFVEACREAGEPLIASTVPVDTKDIVAVKTRYLIAQPSSEVAQLPISTEISSSVEQGILW